MTSYRLGPDRSPGHGIDRAEQLTVTVDGAAVPAFAGDSVASALIASGDLTCGPSLYRARPRGILSAGVEEPNALLSVEARMPGTPTESMLPATTVEAVDGLHAHWLQGKGVLDPIGDDAYYDRKYVHTDVLVVGAGPAGIAAAREAGKTGARTLLLDEQSRPGGSLLSGRDENIDGSEAVAWATAVLDRLAAQPEFTYLRRATAIGSYDSNYVVAVERRSADVDTPPPPGVPRERVWHIRAKKVVLATGAHERPLVFADNDRPGVMLAGAVRTYLNRYATAAGSSIAVVTTNDSAYCLVEDLHAAGITVPVVVDTRTEPTARARAVLEATGTRAVFGAAVVGTSDAVTSAEDAASSASAAASSAEDAVRSPARTPATITGRLTGVSFAAVDDSGRIIGDVESVDADVLAVAGGHSPVLHLHTQRTGRTRWNETLAAFVPEAPVAGQTVVGSANGAVTLADALAEGAHAGHDAAAATGSTGPLVVPTASAEEVGSVRPLWLVASPRNGVGAVNGEGARNGVDAVNGEGARNGVDAVNGKDAGAENGDGNGDGAGNGGSSPEGDNAGGGISLAPEAWDTHVVDLQRDQTVADVLRAVGAGMRSVEHIKRYTSISTANDQGKTSSVNAMGVIASLLDGADPASVGTSTNRPPYTPVAFAALAGRRRGDLYEPARVTNIQPWHVAQGALFEDVGQWKRPWYFPQGDEDMDAAVLRECAAVRTSVGFMDASTLGKIEIRGADAPEFLNRIYTNGFAKLAVGKGRYGLMCTPDGMLFDDGVTIRLADDRFLMTTTTGGAAGVLDWLEEWHQTEWPGMDVYFTSVTEQWNTVAVVGPRSRDVVAKIAPDLDVSNDAFPFMEIRETTLANGIPARICRVSFSGELAFEVNVDNFYGLAAWELIAEAGAEFDITPYGTETMHVLRAEKGLVIIGQDTDGTVTPHDAGMGWTVSKFKDFIGKRSFQRADTSRSDRKHFVGVLPVDGVTRLDEGAQLIAAGTPVTPQAGPVPMIGHVTSSYMSAELGRPFGLALVENGFNRMGEIVQAPANGGLVDVEIVSSVFIDPEGNRRDG